MSDSQIIREFIEINVPDDHPSIYIFINGRERSQQTAVNQIAKLGEGILSPPYTMGHIRTVARSFLNEKKRQYRAGLIEIKPLY
jgi:hypothetical protein